MTAARIKKKKKVVPFKVAQSLYEVLHLDWNDDDEKN